MKWDENLTDLENAARLVKGSESLNNYGKAGDIKDGAGLTAGAYQFTEKAGSLAGMIAKYRELGGEFKNKDIADKLSKSGGLTLTASERDILAEEMKGLKDDETFKQAQDEYWKSAYYDKSTKIANKYGITDPKMLALLATHQTNKGNIKGIISTLKAKHGDDLSGVTMDELAKARASDLRDSGNYYKFQDGMENRLANDYAALDVENWSKPTKSEDIRLVDTVPPKKEEYFQPMEVKSDEDIEMRRAYQNQVGSVITLEDYKKMYGNDEFVQAQSDSTEISPKQDTQLQVNATPQPKGNALQSSLADTSSATKSSVVASSTPSANTLITGANEAPIPIPMSGEGNKTGGGVPTIDDFTLLAANSIMMAR